MRNTNRRSPYRKPFTFGPSGFLGSGALWPVVDDLLQWVLKTPYDATEAEWPDSSGNDNVLLNINSNCITLNGTDQLITGITGLTASDTVTNMGTATATAGIEEITFTAGSAYGLSINGEVIYPCSEGAGADLCSIEPDLYPDATLDYGSGSTTVMWSGRQDVNHHNLLLGYSKVLVLNGSSSKAVIDNTTDYSADNWTLTGIIKSPTNIMTSRTVISQQDGSGAGRSWLYFDVTTEQIRTAIGGAGVALMDDPCVCDTWYNIKLVHDADANTLTLSTGLIGDVMVEHSPVSVVMEPASGDLIIGSSKADSSWYLGELANLALDGVFNLSAANSYDTTLPDISGNGNDATLVDVDFKYYPALADGSDDVAGLGLTNPAGNWDNFCETESIQDVNNPDIADLLTRTIFSDDGATLTARSPQERWEYVNGTENVFYLRETVNDAMRISEALVYDYDKEWTASEWSTLQAYLGSDEGDSIEPITDGGEYVLDGGYLTFDEV